MDKHIASAIIGGLLVGYALGQWGDTQPVVMYSAGGVGAVLLVYGLHSILKK